MIQGFAIVVLCVLVCVTYGVLHDQITARVCIEYFTVAHPPVLDPAFITPTMIAFVWGVIATWWVGVVLGIPLALVSRLGRWPKRDAMSLLWPLLIVATCSAVAAAIAGGVGYVWATAFDVSLPPKLGEAIAREKHAAFIADFFAHNASYAGGFIGGVVLIARTYVWRRRQHRMTLDNVITSE